MGPRKEIRKIISDIKRNIPEFDEEELDEYTRYIIPFVYEEIRKGNHEELKSKFENEFALRKMVGLKGKYRITDSIDNMNIQNVRLYDYINENGANYIKVSVSIYFYDDVGNNIDIDLSGDKYWNDIWIITYVDNGAIVKKNSNCHNCGAVMKYDRVTKMFNCEYCGNTIESMRTIREWKIVDVEVDNDNLISFI